MRQVRAAINAPPHAYGVWVLEYPTPEIRVHVRDGHPLDTARLPARVGRYRVVVDDEPQATALSAAD